MYMITINNKKFFAFISPTQQTFFFFFEEFADNRYASFCHKNMHTQEARMRFHT